MTKADLIREISQQTGIERAIVAQVIEGVMEGIKSSLIGGEEVFLRGFGSFILKKRARNISRNTTIIVPEHTIPAFKPSKAFAEKVR